MDPFIYLSYRGEEPEALAVLRRLEADGFPVRNDRSPVPDGAALERCAEQLAQCSAFVSLITEEYKDSDWCVNDLVIAQEKDIPILPIVLSASVPARLLLIIVTMRQIHRSAYDDEDAFFREIYASRALAAFSPAPEAADETTLRFPDGAEYRGALLGGQPHGEGRLRYADGRVYEGTWNRGKRCGHGRQTWPGGRAYDGEWDNDRICGWGVMTYPERDRPGRASYEGMWEDGLFHGPGTLRYRDGSADEGEWERNRLKSAAAAPAAPEEEILDYADGSRYEGQTRSGFPHGEGTMHFAPDDPYGLERYTGSWLTGKRHGRGLQRWRSGDEYEGDWDANRMQGQGVYRYADGRRYEGPWHDGQPHGEGVFIDTDGTVYKGTFENGLQEGRFLVLPQGNEARAEHRWFYHDEPVN